MADGALEGRLREVGNIVAATARAYSGWSHRIPGTIRSHIDVAGAGVIISAGGPGAPHAITFEAPKAPFWRHPVFATGPRETWNWVGQIPPRRFLLPAISDTFDATFRVIVGVVDDWAHDRGFE